MMTFDEYCEIIDKSNFMIDSDMKILKVLEKCVEEKPTGIRIVEHYNSKVGYCSKCMRTVFDNDNYCPKCGQAIDWSDNNDTKSEEA